MENLITYKIKYSTDNQEFILNCIKDYNKVLKFTYNRILENNKLTTKEITKLQKTLSNVSLDSHFKNSSIFEAKALIKKDIKSVCFGKNFYNQYIKGLITKDELRIKRLVPLYSIGEAVKKANRKFEIIDNKTVIFKPNRNNHVILNLENYKNYKKNLLKLSQLQNNREIAITYKLDLDYVYITFDLNKVKEIEAYKPIENRIFAIDMNPNYIGYSVVDWLDEMNYKIINSGVISIKDLNDYDNSLKGQGFSSDSKERKYVNRKRNYEIVKIVQKLTALCKHYKSEIFVVEDLKMKSGDRGRGTAYNKLCNNQWCRTKFTQQLEKYCKLNSIQLLKVMANYSSFLGNLVYRQENLPDMVLSSIEIGRRGYEFSLQYIKKIKDKKKNIIFPDLKLVKDRVIHALEVLGYSESWINLQKLYYSLKNSKLKYRVPLDKNLKFFRLTYRKSFINLYSFV